MSFLLGHSINKKSRAVSNQEYIDFGLYTCTYSSLIFIYPKCTGYEKRKYFSYNCQSEPQEGLLQIYSCSPVCMRNSQSHTLTHRHIYTDTPMLLRLSLFAFFQVFFSTCIQSRSCFFWLVELGWLFFKSEAEGGRLRRDAAEVSCVIHCCQK